jgi:hypothetical protein
MFHVEHFPTTVFLACSTWNTPCRENIIRDVPRGTLVVERWAAAFCNVFTPQQNDFAGSLH